MLHREEPFHAFIEKSLFSLFHEQMYFLPQLSTAQVRFPLINHKDESTKFGVQLPGKDCLLIVLQTLHRRKGLIHLCQYSFTAKHTAALC